TPCSLVFKRKVEDFYSLSLVRTQKSMDNCKEDLLAQIAQCGGKPVRTEYPLAGGASKPSKSQSLPATNPSPYNAMARAILSVALAIFLAAILALSFAQATSAEAAGVVTAENAASTALLNEVPREAQRHRKLIPSFADGSSASCQSELNKRTQICNAQRNPDAARRCLEYLALLRQTCLSLMASSP
ncbi:unnamed protein product, partial [Closterium sp. NIES-64]